MVDLAKLGIKAPKKEVEDGTVTGRTESNDPVQSGGTESQAGKNENDAGSDDSQRAAEVRGPATRSAGASLLAKLNYNRRESETIPGNVRTVAGGSVPEGVVRGDSSSDESGTINRPNPLGALLKRNQTQRQDSPEKDKVNLPAVQAPSVLDTPVEEVIPPGPDGFKLRLDMLDALIKRDAGISDVMLGMVKTRIKDIVSELKEFPEYDGLIIDRDIHNIMIFMNKSVSTAKAGFVEKEKKRTTRAVRAAKFDFGDVGTGPALALDGPELNLDALSEMNLDTIKAKVR